MPKSLYTRMPCIKFKSVIITAAVLIPKCLYTRLPCIKYKRVTQQPLLIPKCLYTRLLFIKYKNAICTAAVSHAQGFFTHGCRSFSIKSSLTRQLFSMKKFYIHCCRASSMKWISVFTRQSFLKQKQNKTKNARIACFLEIY